MEDFLYRILNYLIIDKYRRRKTLLLDALAEKGFEISHNDSNHLFKNFQINTWK